MTVTLVTGGNRGIGYAIVKVLAARLASPSIIIGCRDVASGQKAVGELRGGGITADIDVVRMDIEDDDCIREAVAALPPAAVVSYCASKAALNMLTLHLQLEEDGRGEGEAARVGYWAASPGHCSTAFNGFRGRKEPEEGAEVVARLLEAAEGEFEAGTFWQCEDGVLGEVTW
ncbi:hypothetical protein LLEC1_00993 [Akanthomyces lecanii]|uniref:Ketoreductase (KR) domain-containing protein n=1 Tax=Cordyceps confragosa TaxID=2714763 RepID=A0A179I4H3_CORDF|nr:hypothetical protein LLEC1_00993 [Akanthomyces lecanii]